MDTQTNTQQDQKPRYHRLNAAQMQLVQDRLNDRTLNITEVAKDCELSRAMFYYITRGQSSTTPAKLERIALRLNIDPKILCS